jgi:hypothetical protein|eukprot:jgi/Chrpa1/5570/Chrysochromulina_OHIO_Genome00012610-RA
MTFKVPAVLLFTLPATAIAFVTSPTQLQVMREASAHVRMGLFEDLKKGFENDPRLVNDRVVPGKAKNVPSYVKQKEAVRQKDQPKQQPKSKKQAEPQGDRTMAEIFKDWKW